MVRFCVNSPRPALPPRRSGTYLPAVRQPSPGFSRVAQALLPVRGPAHRQSSRAPCLRREKGIIVPANRPLPQRKHRVSRLYALPPRKQPGCQYLRHKKANCSSYSPPTRERLRGGDQDLRNQFGFGGGPWVVEVVFDAEVVAHLNFLIGNYLENAAGSFRQIRVRPS